jgi:hypothetical protein
VRTAGDFQAHVKASLPVQADPKIAQLMPLLKMETPSDKKVTLFVPEDKALVAAGSLDPAKLAEARSSLVSMEHVAYLKYFCIAVCILHGVLEASAVRLCVSQSRRSIVSRVNAVVAYIHYFRPRPNLGFFRENAKPDVNLKFLIVKLRQIAAIYSLPPPPQILVG